MEVDLTAENLFSDGLGGAIPPVWEINRPYWGLQSYTAPQCFPIG